MSDELKRRLRIKYGLPEYPSDAQIANWVASVAELILDGENAEEAGRKAACEAFVGVDTVILLSEADTIQALLAQARAK